MLCFVGLPLGIMGNKWFFSSLSSLAREAGGFGCLGGKTNTLPQISSSHSLELVLAKTPLSGDSTKAQANHTFEEGGPQERWGGRLGWSSSGANGGWSGSLSGDVKTESSGDTDGQGVLAPFSGSGQMLSFRLVSEVSAETRVHPSSQPIHGCPGKAQLQQERRRKELTLHMNLQTLETAHKGKFKIMAL